MGTTHNFREEYRTKRDAVTSGNYQYGKGNYTVQLKKFYVLKKRAKRRKIK